MSIARLQSYSLSGSNERNFGFPKFCLELLRPSTQVMPVQRKPFLAGQCSQNYEYFVILALTWTKTGIIAPMSVLSG